MALVTGAGSGIGRATAFALAANGARVVLVGRQAATLEATAAAVSSASDTTFPYVADVTDSTAVERLADMLDSKFRRIDVVINNAGMNIPSRALNVLTVETWKAVIDVNLHGPFLITRAVLPLMRRQASGTIVNIASMAGITMTLLPGPAYSAAKRALISLTESINLAERRHGIRACAICPGEVATPILDQRPVPPPAEARVSMLQPEDVASTIVHVVTLPQRAAIELVTILPTSLRDTSAEVQ